MARQNKETPEAKAREVIDRLLTDAGWTVQDYGKHDLNAGRGVAVCYYPLSTGDADYLLAVDRKFLGVVEAKAEGITLSGVESQSAKYGKGLPPALSCWRKPLPFLYESTGVETYFTDLRDPDPRSRPVYGFHHPETLLEWVGEPDSFRRRLQILPSLEQGSLWDCQVEAIKGLEKSLTGNRPRSLIHSATGSGKTFMMVNAVWRLLKYADCRRVLFLVDRNPLGKQTETEFKQFTVPHDGRKFNEIYNIQRMSSSHIDKAARVVICTIQRMYSVLLGRDLEPDADEESWIEQNFLKEEVAYNAAVPIETFDVVITDECHRSIYHLWSQVLSYFDAFQIGLTATPAKHTYAYFRQNVVFSYPYEKAVTDGVLVDYDAYKIRTNITEQGGTIEGGFFVPVRDKHTRRQQWVELDDDLTYSPEQLDRDVVAPNQIRTILEEYKARLADILFPDRTHVPKTLIFAKDDNHAEDIVRIAREVFGKGNEFVKKITYRVTGVKSEDLINEFRTSYYPRIAVTVDMISTGVDVKPIEVLIFMRQVKSRLLLEQMIGRGTRTISPPEMRRVTPDCKSKDRFVVVDCVGALEAVITTAPLERKRSKSFEELLADLAAGRDLDDTIPSVISRLCRLRRKVRPAELERVKPVTDGKSLDDLIKSLEAAIDDVGNGLCVVPEAIAPFRIPKLVDLLCELRRMSEQVIDESVDFTTVSEFDADAKTKAQSYIAQFRQYVTTHKDEIIALQILLDRPHGKRLTLAQVKELANALERERLTTEQLWRAYETLDRSKVRGANAERLLADIVSVVRHAVRPDETLEPHRDVIHHRFDDWLARQQAQGRTFNDEQRRWLTMIRDHIVNNFTIEEDDFDFMPFDQRGGRFKARALFGEGLRKLLDELNEELAA